MQNSNTDIIDPVVVKSKALEAHWLVHHACFAISENKLEEAQKMLAEADQILHDIC